MRLSLVAMVLIGAMALVGCYNPSGSSNETGGVEMPSEITFTGTAFNENVEIMDSSCEHYYIAEEPKNIE